ncbi:MAG TPA: hypothetical protein VFL13_13715 [Candidatus Baltobacteraceae bacterium]|nr:hypothetical protein [Candidatus Baltobacteraceae bacterium]
MSYDLIVRGVHRVPLEQIRSAASRAPWLEIDGDERGVLLTNTNTGVYVTLTPENGHVVYAINYQRPSFFAREGLLTIGAFAEQFTWDVYDPQLQTAYTRECFADAFASWQRGNAEAPSPRSGVPIGRFDASRVWEWNYERPQREERLAAANSSAYVPRVYFVEAPGIRHARTMMLWPQDVRSLLLPETDYIVFRPARSDDGDMVDRAALLEAAAYYALEHETSPGIALLEAPRFSLLLSAIERSKRGRFKGSVVACDMLTET